MNVSLPSARSTLTLPPLLKLAEQHLVGQHARDFVFDQTAQRPRAESMIVTVLGEPLFGLRRNFKFTFLRLSVRESSPRNLSTTCSITTGPSGANSIIAESRLRNSGENIRSMTALGEPVVTAAPNPIIARDSSCAPALVVITIITLRKSALRPLLSVSVA